VVLGNTSAPRRSRDVRIRGLKSATASSTKRSWSQTRSLKTTLSSSHGYCFHNFWLQSCVIKQTTFLFLRFERSLSPQWYKLYLLLPTRLPNPRAKTYIGFLSHFEKEATLLHERAGL